MSTSELDSFANLIAGQGLRLPIQDGRVALTRRPGRADALFHLPLLSLSILVISRHANISTDQVGRRVARLLIEHFKKLRDVGTLEWSITLRRRCAEALTFLEASRIVEISVTEPRHVVVTALGKGIFARGLRDESDVGALCRGLVRASSRARARAGEQ